MIQKEQMLQKIRSDSQALIDVHTHVGISVGSYVTQGYPYCLSLEDLAIRMQALGISYSVVFPYGSLYYAVSRSLEQRVRVTRRISRFPYEIANRNLLNEIFGVFPQYSDRVVPFAMFDPSRKQSEQVGLLQDLAARYPLYGLKTVTSYSQAHIRDLLSKRGARIVDFAREMDIPITIHTSVAPGDPWANVFAILDVVIANPDVRFCLAHSCRFDKRALDTAHRLANCFVGLSAFHIHCLLAEQGSPSIAEKAERFDADFSKPLEALKGLSEAYPQTICWATDTPAYYYINSWVDEQGKMHQVELKCDWDVEARALQQLDGQIRRRIAYENPLRLLFGGKQRER